MIDRKLKRLLIPREAILALLDGYPADAQFHDLTYCPDLGGLLVTSYSIAYDPVSPGIPLGVEPARLKEIRPCDATDGTRESRP